MLIMGIDFNGGTASLNGSSQSFEHSILEFVFRETVLCCSLLFSSRSFLQADHFQLMFEVIFTVAFQFFRGFSAFSLLHV